MCSFLSTCYNSYVCLVKNYVYSLCQNATWNVWLAKYICNEICSQFVSYTVFKSRFYVNMQVTEEAGLTTAKRLHVSEKSWAKLANHFTILLSDKDTDLITKIQVI